MNRRTTKNKKEIMAAFKHSHILNAVQLSELLPHIDITTIYRNLRRFEEDGLIKQVSVDDSSINYELAGEDDHQHFVCESCNEVKSIMINTNEIEKNIQNVGAVKNVEIIVRGECVDCTNINIC